MTAIASIGAPARRLLSAGLPAALVSLGYYVGAVTGSVVSVPPTGFAIIWPATSVLTAAFLLTPARAWWIYLLGVLPVHLLLVRAVDPVPLTVALIQVSGNLGLAATTAVVVRWAHRGVPRFDAFKEVFRFAILAGVLVPAVVNALILAAHLAAGSTNDFWLSWRQWLLASIFPTVVVTPVLVLAVSRRLQPGASLAHRLELLTACAATFLISALVFGADIRAEYWPTLLLTPLPLLLWSAMRWGVGGAGLALLAFAGAVMVRALQGFGPFAIGSPMATVVSLQVFLTAASVPLLLLAALMEERTRTARLLLHSEQRMGIAAASTDTGLWQWDHAAGRLWMTEHCRAMFGLTAEAPAGPQVFLDGVHPDDRPGVAAALEATLAGPDPDATAEFRIGTGVETRWLMGRIHAERDRSGRLSSLSGVFRDVSQRVEAQQRAEQLTQALLTLQDDERRSIAGELHDSTGQHLAAMSLNLNLIRRRLGPRPELGALLDDIQASLREASHEIRIFTYLLRAPELERHGLIGALTQYVRGFARRTGLEVCLRLTPFAEAIPAEQQRALLRITQESLANVHRHAAARRVSVHLRRRGELMHLVVRDNGRGFRAAAEGRIWSPGVLGVGIPGMNARVQHLGGRMILRSSANGTRVHVVLPSRKLAASSRPFASGFSPFRPGASAAPAP